MDTKPTLCLPIDSNWTDSDGNHSGGQSTGIGYTIAWQRGPLTGGRNGAFMLEILASCQQQMQYYKDSNPQFACKENDDALIHLTQCIQALNDRKSRRTKDGTIGTHKPESQS